MSKTKRVKRTKFGGCFGFNCRNNSAVEEQPDEDGNTALMRYCLDNDNESAITLIARQDCNPGQFNNFGQTALIIACNNKLSEVALALIERQVV